MHLKIVEERPEPLVETLVTIWESSVRATHYFLSEPEIARIKEYVPSFIEAIPTLLVAEDDNGHALAFMGIEDGRLEMLFVSAETRGQGIGKALLEVGIREHGVNDLTVNEQNPEAVGFYEHMGFEAYKRTDLDEEGNPYPLLYMRLGE